jgi:uncharacterized protein (DUF849 family)
MEKMIFTAGVTGSRINRSFTPLIPILLEEMAKSRSEAVKAGAEAGRILSLS